LPAGLLRPRCALAAPFHPYRIRKSGGIFSVALSVKTPLRDPPRPLAGTLPDDGNLHELDEGELVVMPPPGFEHGIIQAAVGENLRQAARSGCGGMVTTESGFRFAPDVIQGSDVASVR